MTEATAVKPEESDETAEEGLKPRDRCDATASGSEQAFVRLKHKDTGHVLQFCSHHTARYEADLIGKGFLMMEDLRSTVNSKPSPSASVIAESPETKFDEFEDDE